MAFNITIQGTVISFPSSGESPNWAPALIQFAQAVEDALQGLVGAGDISPQSYTMVSNTNTDVAIPGFQFSTTQIRGANIRYTVYRTNTVPSSTVVAEKGDLEIVYNPQNPVNFKWEISREYVGDAQVTFSIDDTGQVKFSSDAVGSGTHTGVIKFAAVSLLQ